VYVTAAKIAIYFYSAKIYFHFVKLFAVKQTREGLQSSLAGT
jgi:hypothetical protein